MYGEHAAARILLAMRFDGGAGLRLQNFGRGLVVLALLLAGCAASSSKDPDRRLTREEFEREADAIGEEGNGAMQRGDYDRAAAAADKLIDACLRTDDPTAPTGAAWIANAEVVVLMNKGEFKRAAARGERNFEVLAGDPNSLAPMARTILKLGDNSQPLLALADRLLDRADREARRTKNSAMLDRVAQERNALSAAYAKAATQPREVS